MEAKVFLPWVHLVLQVIRNCKDFASKLFWEHKLSVRILQVPFLPGGLQMVGTLYPDQSSPLTSHEPWSSPGHLRFNTQGLFFP